MGVKNSCCQRIVQKLAICDLGIGVIDYRRMLHKGMVAGLKDHGGVGMGLLGSEVGKMKWTPKVGHEG